MRKKELQQLQNVYHLEEKTKLTNRKQHYTEYKHPAQQHRERKPQANIKHYMYIKVRRLTPRHTEEKRHYKAARTEAKISAQTCW
jgi:hypothetical protein